MPRPDPDVSKRLDVAVDAALSAGFLAFDAWHGETIEFARKPDNSIVTPYDVAAEQRIIDMIGAKFPGDAWMCEESGNRPGDSGFKWIVDPIDGTTSFSRKMPTWGVLIGLEQGGKIVAGVCFNPAVAEIGYAAIGGGTWWARQVHQGQTGEQVRSRVSRAFVSKVTDTAEAFAISCTLKSWQNAGYGVQIERLRKKVRRLQLGGYNCFDYLLVATGRLELSLDPVMQPWDLAALAPIVTEAGGVFTDLAGVDSVYSGHSMAGVPEIHAAAVDAFLAASKQE